MSVRSGIRPKYDSDDEDDEMSTMASPVGLYQKPSRGRTDEKAGDGERSASRSRSRSSSVLRRIIGVGRKDKSKSSKTDDGMSVTSCMTSPASIDTKNVKIKTIKKLRKSDGSSRRSSSCDRTRSSSCDRTTRSKSSDRTRSRSKDRPSHHSFSGPVDMEDDPSPLDKKLRKKSKLKYKSRLITDSGGVDSDGDYGAADSDGDVGSIDGGRSVRSEGILSSRRKVRRKKKPKKTNCADDDTLGSSKASIGDSSDFCKTPRIATENRRMHGFKVASIPEPPTPPEGEMLKIEMDNLFPSPKSEKKKLPRVKRKGKQPDIPVIAFQKDEFNPIVDRTPGARPSDYRKSQGRGSEDSTFTGRPPLSQYSQNHDSGLSTDAYLVPTSNRSSKSFRSFGKGGGDNDTVLSLTDTVSSLNRHLDDHREENKDLQKRLTEALSKVASLNEDLRIQEGNALKAEAHVAQVKAEKSDLQNALFTMKEDMIAKEERIDKLQHVVETQLDTIEFLEVRLEQTEDELFKMEDELKHLDAGGYLDQSVHAKSLLNRKESLEKDMITRKGSIRIKTEESRSILGGINKRSRSISNVDELQQREAKIIAREKKLVEWEKSLVKVDVQFRQGSDETEVVSSFKAKLQLMEKRERRMEENRDLLLQEKDELVEKVLLLESQSKDSMSPSVSNNEEVDLLKGKISKLENESNGLLAEIAEFKATQKMHLSQIKGVESDKQDLRVKLDHVRATAMKEEEDHRLQRKSMEEELTYLRGKGESGRDSGLAEVIQKLKGDIADKDSRIYNLESKLEQAGAKLNDDEDEGKYLLIRELQNQLVAAKKEAHDFSSGDYVKRLKSEVKTLKQGYNDVKKRMKSAEINAQGALKKKDESLQAMKAEMATLRRDLERLEKREKNLKVDGMLEEGDLQKHIEDLEDEIDHWKATNAHLESELDLLKAEFSEFKKDTKSDDAELDDDASIGSLQSLNSLMSEQQGMEMSSHSVSTGLFFVSDSTSMRTHRSISVAPTPQPPGEEPTTPSQRALRSVSTLWSKMRNEPSHPANPAIPYGAGILDDD